MGSEAPPAGRTHAEGDNPLSEFRYVIRPAADRDLDDQASYYAVAGTIEVGHRFLLAAHETFALLASRPHMGWRPRLLRPRLRDLRVFRVNTFERILSLYLPLLDGVDILRVIHGSRNMEAFFLQEGL